MATVLKLNRLLTWTNKPTLRKNKRAAKPTHKPTLYAALLFLPNRTKILRNKFHLNLNNINSLNKNKMKTKNLNLSILLFFVLAGSSSFGQGKKQETKKQESKSIEFWNSSLEKIAKTESVEGWIKFKEDINIDARNIFSEQKEAFNLKENDKMTLFKIEKDDLGFTHYRYQQYYKNIKIEGGEFIVHANKNGITYAGNGKLFRGIDIPVVPILGTQQAIDFVLKHVSAKEYMWQSEVLEKDLKERTGKSDTTFYPTAQLVIKEIKNNDIKSDMPDKQYFLAYRLDIYSSAPNYSQRIFIDANTGKFLESFPLQSN